MATSTVAVAAMALSEKDKKEIVEALDNLVRHVPPSELQSTEFWKDKYYTNSQLEDYFKALKNYIKKTPSLLSGIKLESKARLDLDALWKQPDEKAWLKAQLLDLIKKYRPAKTFAQIDHIPAKPTGQWTDWHTQDCVFLALLGAMGIRIGTGGKKVKSSYVEDDKVLKLEEEMVNKVAGLLKLDKQMVPDELLVHLMETRLGWNRLPVKTLKDLHTSTAKDDRCIVTYCADAYKDQWHTVLAERTKMTGVPANDWEVIDRQNMRRFGREGVFGLPGTEANAWKIATTSELLGALKADMGLQAYLEKNPNILKLASS